MNGIQPDDPAGNFIKLVEATIEDGDYPFMVETAWEDDDEVPRIAYRTQETTDDGVWEEATQFIGVLMNVYRYVMESLDEQMPEEVVGVTLPHIDSDMDGATGWLLKRHWLVEYYNGDISEEDLLHLINETRHHVVEREMLAAVDGEESLRWDENPD